ncbi:ABC transporter permease [Amycolatopsis cihanbeyliensis]|uniref:Oligopeptide transport system permease protein n=1 Tax=Amycolatopsis cihanbeyliensis TaxID=1128664 RepID=A0A542DLU9_AMYCI|nr:ABC transporter permease [Amycolatopsis cihanbeyliensis]TQJ04072.1 oligopeptide transport system permease protein [Amycolatopsis cihanbeyliensis]
MTASEDRGDLTPDMFQPAELPGGEAETLAGTPVGFWRDAWRRLRRNRWALVAGVLISVIILFALFAPLFTATTGYGQNLGNQYATPSGDSWFGTDKFGRSMWDRVWEGTRVSLFIAFLAAFIDLGIGMFYGAISAYYGGKVDNVMQRIVEIVIGIPNLVVLILVMLFLSPGILTITLALTITGWTASARLIRGQVLRLKEEEFFLAARVLGARTWRLLSKHLIPNVLYLVIINLMLTVPSAIFFEAFLSFIGLGISPPDASLGSLINSAADTMQYYPYLLIIPAAVLSVLTIGFRVLGDGLRDALDPRLRR